MGTVPTRLAAIVVLGASFLCFFKRSWVLGTILFAVGVALELTNVRRRK